jgi:hypothetical protein
VLSRISARIRPLTSVLRLAAMILLVLSVSGCGGAVTEEIWLKGGERWKVNLALSLNDSERSIMEGSLEQQDWEELVEEARAADISLDWSQREDSEGGLTYSVSMEGRGLDKLNEATFDGAATITKDESDHIHLDWRPRSTATLRSYTLTIHGGKIISSNADEETKNAATWHNPARVQVEMKEGGAPIPTIMAVWVACACLAGLLVAGGVFVFVLVRQRKSNPASTA